MRDTCDFPAAHSMDTTWFAIDQEGNLGIFESRENGPVPAQFSVQDMGYQVLQIAREEVFSGRKPIDLSIVKESSRQSHIDAMQFFSSYAPSLMQQMEVITPSPISWFFNRLSLGLYQPKARLIPIKKSPSSDSMDSTITHDNIVVEVSSWDALMTLGLSGTIHRLVTLNESVVVALDQLSKADWEKMHNHNVCVFCCDFPIELYQDVALGFFHYDGDSSWYQRLHMPVNPLKMFELQDKLPAELPRLHLPFKFADQPHYQPLTTMECNTWGDTSYYTVPGTTNKQQIKPIPGREEAYRKWYHEEYLPHKDDWYQDIAVEAPK
ncbi:MAG: hypothetical protein U0796_08610 [Gemmatales bacterium]